MKTKDIMHDLELLTTCGMTMSQNTHGRSPVQWATMMTSLIFGRLVLNGISVLRLTPGSNFCKPIGTLQVWDLSAVASLSRNLVEGYFVLHYMAEMLPDDQARLRELVWRHHDVSERLKMLRESLPQSPGVAVLQKQVASLQQTIKSSPAFLALTSGLRQRIIRGEAAKLRTNEELRLTAGVDKGYYNSMFKYGSNHTHSSPFCFRQMDSYNASQEPEQVEAVFWTALEASAGFLAMAIVDFLKLFPDQRQCIGSEEQLA